MRQTLLLTSLALAMVCALAEADLTDNQIGDFRPNARLGRPYAVRGCRRCGSGECQVMGMQRFSEPRCEAFGSLGSPCRMWQEPENKTLHFPTGIMLCNDVYMQFCPCEPGLVCERAECRPAPQSKSSPVDETRQLEREERDSFGEDENEEMPIAFEPNQSKFPWGVARFH